jgi:hypothetical protein
VSVAKRNRTIGSVKLELITKSREAALCAIRTFNDPQVQFKSETFIVLMMIAWTYLLHAYYRSRRIEYRYFEQGPKRKKFDTTKRGAFKYWELERCLDEKQSPIDKDTANNLRFLIGLRHEIEHQMTHSLDAWLSGRYQACALNYNAYIKKLFGARHGLDKLLTFSIQFLELAEEQIAGKRPEATIPQRLRAYIADFDGSLSSDAYRSERFSYRLLFTRKMVNRPGQADKVIEFVSPDSEIAKAIDKEHWVKKEVERKKYRAKDVVAEAHKAGFTKLSVFRDHAAMWKAEDAKNPGKGFGVDVQGTWFWYQSWVDRVLELCAAAGGKFKSKGGEGKP